MSHYTEWLTEELNEGLKRGLGIQNRIALQCQKPLLSTFLMNTTFSKDFVVVNSVCAQNKAIGSNKKISGIVFILSAAILLKQKAKGAKY